jgi:hypothetical protein
VGSGVGVGKGVSVGRGVSVAGAGGGGHGSQAVRAANAIPTTKTYAYKRSITPSLAPGARPTTGRSRRRTAKHPYEANSL